MHYHDHYKGGFFVFRLVAKTLFGVLVYCLFIFYFWCVVLITLIVLSLLLNKLLIQ